MSSFADRLDAAMLQGRARRDWWLPGLGARGPVPVWRTELATFGRFVGSWDILPPRGAWVEGRAPEPRGRAEFRWILGGTALQDIWGPLDPHRRELVPHGTTVRFFDPGLGAWRSTWLSPYQRAVRRFVGRERSGEIVLREQGAGWRAEHWIFSEIAPGSFRWRAEGRRRAGGPRRVVEDYVLRRR